MNKSTILSYEDLPTYTRPGVTVFNAETYVGNWYEQTVRNTFKRDEFIRKRECGELTIQKTQNMVDLLLKPVEFQYPQPDECLRYGDKLQILAPGPSCKLAKEVYPFKRTYCKIAHLALSSSVPPMAIDHAPYLSTDSIISASPHLFPVVRNSFIIEHPDCPTAHVGEIIEYGDVFRIRAFDTQHFKLYLFSAPAIRVHSLAAHSAKPKVRFSDLPLQETLWTTFPLGDDDKLRMELGVPVRLRTPLLIRHNLSGQNLSYESMFSVLTYFGCELEVTLDTKLDKIKRPTFENIWYFDNNRGLPKETDPCVRDFTKQAEFSAKINANMVNRSASESAQEEDVNREEDNPEENDDCKYGGEQDSQRDKGQGQGEWNSQSQGPPGQSNNQGQVQTNGQDRVQSKGRDQDQANEDEEEEDCWYKGLENLQNICNPNRSYGQSCGQVKPKGRDQAQSGDRRDPPKLIVRGKPKGRGKGQPDSGDQGQSSTYRQSYGQGQGQSNICGSDQSQSYGQGQPQPYGEGQPLPYGQGQPQSNGRDQGDIPRTQDVIMDAEKMMAQMSLQRSKGGYRAYDPATAPQPNAWSYATQEDTYFPNYPNQKWDCGNTNCCYAPPLVKNTVPDEEKPPKCSPCCVEPGPRPESLNIVAGSNFNRLIM